MVLAVLRHWVARRAHARFLAGAALVASVGRSASGGEAAEFQGLWAASWQLRASQTGFSPVLCRLLAHLRGWTLALRGCQRPRDRGSEIPERTANGTHRSRPWPSRTLGERSRPHANRNLAARPPCFCAALSTRESRQTHETDAYQQVIAAPGRAGSCVGIGQP